MSSGICARVSPHDRSRRRQCRRREEGGEALRESPVAKAQRSPSALAKMPQAAPSMPPRPSFQTLLADLATLARNNVVTASAPDRPFTILTRPTAINKRPSTSSDSPSPVPSSRYPDTARHERDQWFALRERKKLRLREEGSPRL